MEWREVRSSETGELLFRFWPEQMLIEVMRRRAGRRQLEVISLRDYLPVHIAGVDFARIEGVDIEAEPM